MSDLTLGQRISDISTVYGLIEPKSDTDVETIACLEALRLIKWTIDSETQPEKVKILVIERIFGSLERELEAISADKRTFLSNIRAYLGF